MLWLLLVCAHTALAAKHSSSHSKTSTSTRTSSYDTHDDNTFITIPLAVPLDDSYYNALVTDSLGNEMGVRVDLLQPDLWLINALDIVDCSVLQSYYDDVTGSTIASSFSYSSETWNANICYADGAYTPVTVTTSTGLLTTETVTVTADVQLDSTFAVAYPNGIYANGVLYTANFSLGTTDNEKLEMDDFEFVLTSNTNMYAGGLGLSRSPSGHGLLDTLKSQGHILSSGYSLFFSGYEDLNTTAGELLLGAVDQNYYSGDLYQFPYIPYEGWSTQLNSFAPLPIVALEGITLENGETSELVSLSTDKYPVVLDTRLSYSFLPIDFIINLAVQTNAYYNDQYERWIVRCSDILDSNATLYFTFGELDVPVPLTALLTDAYYGDSYLYFSTGVRACFLNVMPDLDLGYSSLGLPFLTNVYLAMDNEGGSVAMARANDEYVVEQQDFLFSQLASAYPSSYTASLTNSTSNRTIAYIQSNSIPFATLGTYSSNYTLTFSQANSSNVAAALTRLTVATILSGEVYITNPDGGAASLSGSDASASAANAHTLKSQGHSVSQQMRRESSWVMYAILLTGAVMAVMIA